MKILVTFFAFLPAMLCAQDAAQAPSPEQGFTQTLVMVGIALLFFYVILWRPEQKRRKKMETERNAMKKGDYVVVMGVVGTVSRIKEDTIIVHTGDAEVEFLKAAISEVRSEPPSSNPVS